MWYLESEAYNKLQTAYTSKVDLSAFGADSVAAGPDILNTAGSIASIAIKGILTKTPDFFARYFGGGNTTYESIIESIALAEQDDTISSIILDIDSPGGNISGLFDALAAIEKADKPITAVVNGQAASAAYAIAAQADTIQATSKAASFGSIGIVMRAFIDENVMDITSTEAPKKRPDPKTEQGKKDIVAYLDDIHELFADSIAEGRGISANKVNKEFGQGAMVFATEAQKRGMIDSIQDDAQSISLTLAANKGVNEPSANNGGIKPETKIMDLTKLKAEHPAVYQQAVDEGITQGKAKELDRVSAHIIMGEAVNAMDVAVKAIKDGTEMTATINAEYSAAGFSKKNIDARAADDADASGADDGPPALDPKGLDAEDTVANLVAQKIGGKVAQPNNHQ